MIAEHLIGMKYVFLLLCFFGIDRVAGQSENSADKIFIKVEQASGPESKKLEKYLYENRILDGPEWHDLPVGKQVVELELVIDIHGKPGRFKATNNPPRFLFDRAVKLLRSYPGEWRPASQCGRLVNSYWKYKLVFELR